MLYVLHGPDAFRRGEFLDALRSRLDTDGTLSNSTVRIDGAEVRSLRAPALQAVCQAASFFETGRLVIIEGLGARLSAEEGRRRGRRSDDDPPSFEAFTAVFTNLPPSTHVVLIDDTLGAFYDNLKAVAEVHAFPLLVKDWRQDQLTPWAQERIRQKGFDFASTALQRLLTLVDASHLGQLAQEIDKLATFALGRQVTAADVDAIASEAFDTKAWDIYDPIIEGRPGPALEGIRKAGEEYHPMQILAMVRNQFRTLVVARGMLNEGLPATEIGKALRLQGFRLDKLIKNASLYGGGRAEAAYRLILNADANVKTGVMDVETALPALIVQLAELHGGRRPATAARSSR